jgi:hypothetical protein
MCLPVRKFGFLNFSVLNKVTAHFLPAAIALFFRCKEQTKNHVPYKINFKEISTNLHSQNKIITLKDLKIILPTFPPST